MNQKNPKTKKIIIEGTAKFQRAICDDDTFYSIEPSSDISYGQYLDIDFPEEFFNFIKDHNGKQIRLTIYCETIDNEKDVIIELKDAITIVSDYLANHYKKEETFYPSEIAKALNFNVFDIYSILEELEKEGEISFNTKKSKESIKNKHKK